MSHLKIKPQGKSGRITHVTPESAGWTYVGFDLHRLKPGENVSAQTGGREACLVFVTGKGKVTASGEALSQARSSRHRHAARTRVEPGNFTADVGNGRRLSACSQTAEGTDTVKKRPSKPRKQSRCVVPGGFSTSARLLHTSGMPRALLR